MEALAPGTPKSVSYDASCKPEMDFNEKKKKLTATSLLAQLNSDNAFGGGDDAAVLVAAPGEDMVGSKSKGAGEDDAGEIEVILLGESSLAK